MADSWPISLSRRPLGLGIGLDHGGIEPEKRCRERSNRICSHVLGAHARRRARLFSPSLSRGLDPDFVDMVEFCMALTVSWPFRVEPDTGDEWHIVIRSARSFHFPFVEKHRVRFYPRWAMGFAHYRQEHVGRLADNDYENRQSLPERGVNLGTTHVPLPGRRINRQQIASKVDLHLIPGPVEPPKSHIDRSGELAIWGAELRILQAMQFLILRPDLLQCEQTMTP